jgi:hypothetical protein
MEVSPSRSEPRISVRFPASDGIFPRSLGVNDGVLWMTYRESNPLHGSLERDSPRVAMLEPGSPRPIAATSDPVSPEFESPSVIGNFVYYAVREYRKSALDFLSHAETEQAYTRLYRVPLRR